MQDYAGPIRKRLIQATAEDTPIDAKRRQALAYLGENHMLHPNYKFRPRHAFSAAAWQPHSVLRPVQLAAQQAGRI